MSYNPIKLAQMIVQKLEDKGHIGALGISRKMLGVTGARYLIVCKPISSEARCRTEVSYSFSYGLHSKKLKLSLPTALHAGPLEETYAKEKYSPRIRVRKAVHAIQLAGAEGYLLVDVSIENESKRVHAKELRVSETFEGAEVVVTEGRPRIFTENLIYERLEKGTVVFKDHVVLSEQHLSIKQDSETFKEFASKNAIPDSIVDAFQFKRLMLHQSETYLETRKLYEKSHGKDPDKSILISVRTAGGKTEAFLLYPLTLLASKPQQGVFTIIMYPTKALANDQAKRIFRYIARLNRVLGETRITMGVYHGDTMTEQDEVKAHPFKRCPFCKGKMTLDQTKARFLLKCEKCGPFPSVFLTRKEIESNLPNILITNPDMMHYRLTNFWNHNFFGKPIAHCKGCLYSTYNLSSFMDEKTGRCGKCGGELVMIQSTPRFLIIDEVHLFRGSFGSHVGTLVSELTQLVKQYTGSEPIVIGSSATIDQRDIVRIGQHLLGKDPVFVPKEDVYEKKVQPTEIKRFHLFLMPQGAYWRYSVFGIAMAIDEYGRELNEKIPTLIFANTVKDANNLEKAIAENTKMVTKAHTAELSKTTRQRIEEAFSHGDVDVLAATKTLEVGVDFDNVRALILVGAPFSYNDFIQRIGRAGRGEEAALVITVLRPFIPLDSYYFENCRELLDPELSGLLEAFPIQRNNPFIMRRHARDSILTYIFSKDKFGALSYYQNLRKEIIGVQAKFSRLEIEEWLSGVFMPKWLRQNEREEIKEVITREIDGFYEHLKNRQPRDANETVAKHFERDLRFSLRTNDDEVTVVSNTDPDKILRLTADRFVLPLPDEDEILEKEEKLDERAGPEEPELHVGE